MRRVILNVHLYLLLACSSYLIIFGVSSLLMNHPVDDPPHKAKWEATLVRGEVRGDAKQQAQSVADELGLFGWVIPWETRREADGTLRTSFARPGTKYALQVSPDGKHVTVNEERGGFLAVTRSLHALMRVPGSLWVSTWGWYTRLCSVAVLFAAASGVYLFAVRPPPRRTGWISLAVAGAISLGLMAWVMWAA